MYRILGKLCWAVLTIEFYFFDETKRTQSEQSDWCEILEFSTSPNMFCSWLRISSMNIFDHHVSKKFSHHFCFLTNPKFSRFKSRFRKKNHESFYFLNVSSWMKSILIYPLIMCLEEKWIFKYYKKCEQVWNRNECFEYQLNILSERKMNVHDRY